MNNGNQPLSEVLGMEFGQVYHFEYQGRDWYWSIDMALRIIGDRAPIPQAEMTPDMVKQALASNQYAGEIDPAFAMTRDLSKPIIAIISPVEFVPGRNVLLLIDGWHRLRKSALINHPEPLQCHVLSPAEEQACRIRRIE